MAGSFDILLHMDGADGGTSFVEEGGKTVTRVGTGVTTSTTQAKFGSASATGFSSSSRLTVPTSPMASGQARSVFAWFRWDGASSGNKAIFTLAGGGFLSEVYLRGASGNVLTLYNGSNIITGGTTPTANAWHLAGLEWVGTTVTLTLDGVVQGTATYAGASTGGTLYVGSYSDGSEFFTGYLDEVCLCIGSALFGGAAFTPPDAPFGTPSALSLQAAQTADATSQSATLTARVSISATQTAAATTQTATVSVVTPRSVSAAQTAAPATQTATAATLRAISAAQTAAETTQAATAQAIAKASAAQTAAPATQAATVGQGRSVSAAQTAQATSQTAAMRAVGAIAAAQAAAATTQTATVEVRDAGLYAAQLAEATTQAARINHDYIFERTQRTVIVGQEVRTATVGAEQRRIQVARQSRTVIA